MDVIVQWATILSPIIAVLLAWWTSKSSAKDTAKQIASIKELARIQIKTTQLQISKELFEATTLFKQSSKRYFDEIDRNRVNNQIGYFQDSIRMREDKQRDLYDSQSFYAKQNETLRNIQKQLDELSKKIGEE